jgi:Ni/Co efflux regulator RcnB
MLALLIVATLTTSPALADKNKEHRQERSRDDDRGHHQRGQLSPGAGAHFGDPHRSYVREYYAKEHGRGHCPPGLANKHHGCVPPGHAKKWQIGQPIPRGIVYYDLPQPLVVQIGIPPAGYRYVRAASDILLIAIGSGMVIDAINDLGRL